MDKKRDIQKKETFKQAAELLLQKVQKAEQKIQHEIKPSWEEIETKLNPPHHSGRLRVRLAYSAAASVAILCLLTYFFRMGKDDSSLTLALLNNEMPQQEEILLITQQDKIQIENNAFIRYEKDGQSNIKQHTVDKEKVEKNVGQEEKIVNQIIVPKGKRINITFSDGTVMYVNAGTKVIYPAVFDQDKREILVDGEVYLDVQKAASWPFIVKTNNFNVKVVGTQFNVCAYKEDPSATVTLVNGRVEVKTAGKQKSVLVPNQAIEISDEKTTVKEVDVFDYICWTQNIMRLNDRKLGETFERLSRYYGREIIYDKEIKNIPLSGKLDLRDKLEDVVNLICQSVYLKYEIDEKNNVVILK